jgi:hypothetical protein
MIAAETQALALALAQAVVRRTSLHRMLGAIRLLVSLPDKEVRVRIREGSSSS